MTFDLNEGHHHVKLAPTVLLTKFGSPRALFNVFDPRGPRGPRTPSSCKTFVATPPIHATDQVWSKSNHECGRSTQIVRKKEEEEDDEEERNRKKVIS